MGPRTAERIYRLIIRILTWPQRETARLEEQKKRERCLAHSTSRLLPESQIINLTNKRDRIQIGARTISRGECRVFGPEANITIGSDCYIGDNSKIWSAFGITIGDRVLIAHSVNIHDNDSHPKSAAHRHRQTVDICNAGTYDLTDVGMAPIVIEDDAWIGFNASILKGVTIGKGAIIGAASVITKDVSPYAIMVGNPARQVGTASE
jgi:acetyltransferase-like isoleucine patch superfamily enzyme